LRIDDQEGGLLTHRLRDRHPVERTSVEQRQLGLPFRAMTTTSPAPAAAISLLNEDFAA